MIQDHSRHEELSIRNQEDLQCRGHQTLHSDAFPPRKESVEDADDGFTRAFQVSEHIVSIPNPLRIMIPSTPVKPPSFLSPRLQQEDPVELASSPASESTASDLSLGNPPSYTDKTRPHNSNLEEPVSYSPMEKGKWRMPVEEKDGATPEPFGDSNEVHGQTPSHDLTESERESITNQDEELAMALLFEDLREQGYSAEQIEEYTINLQVMRVQEAETKTFDQHIPASTPSRDNQLTLERSIEKVADNILETYMARDLPPAYGPNYAPEPSTSTSRSPILAARRLSVGSLGDTHNLPKGGSGISRQGSYSNASVLEEDQVLELEKELERRMEELFMHHRANLLRDWESMMSSFKRDMHDREKGRDARRWTAYRHHEQCQYPHQAYDYEYHSPASRTPNFPPYLRESYDGQRYSTGRGSRYRRQRSRHPVWYGQPH